MTETDKANVNVEGSSTASASGSTSESVAANGTPDGNSQSENSELVTLKAKLKTLWSNSKRSGGLTPLNSVLTLTFFKYKNPLEEYLDLLDIIIDNGWTGSFSCYVTRQFVNWLYSPETEKPEGGFKANKSVQTRALNVASNALSKDIMELIFHAYNLSESPELIFLLSNDLKERNRYIQLCHWICLFKVEDKFQLDDYIYPLLLTKNFLDVFPYLEAHPDNVTDVIKFADSILCDNDLIAKLYDEYGMLKKVIPDHISKNIKILMTKIVKRFKVSSDLTPNLNKKMAESQIKYYVLSLSKNEISDEAFKERVESFCEDDVDKQKFLVQHLQKGTRTQYLVEYFCNLYNIDIEYTKGVQRVELEEDFHSVDGLENLIVFVDSVPLSNSLLECIDSLLIAETDENNDFAIPVGIDTEWKSVNSVNVSRPPSLLQIAFEKKIFIVDIAALHDKIEFWEQLNEKLLKNNKFVKLGYGLNNDQCKLDFYSDLSFVNLSGSGSLDILKEERKHYSYNKKSKVTFPFDISRDEAGSYSRTWKGLSKLVALCFSKPLDKREQLSDWERRPLRSAQLKYAALDAYCLIQVYNVLKDMHKKANVKFSFHREGTETKTKTDYYRSYGRRWSRPKYNMKNKFRKNKKKAEASIQAVVDSSEVFTQTDKN